MRPEHGGARNTYCEIHYGSKWGRNSLPLSVSLFIEHSIDLILVQLGRSRRITTLILAGHIDVMDNFLENLINMPKNGHFKHLMVSCFGQTVKRVNQSMFYIKRFIYHRQFSLSLNPIDF